MFNKQKQYFKNRINAIQREIWGSEFDRFKLGEIREEVRQEYDRKKAELVNIEEEIKNQKIKPTLEKGEIARLDDKKVLLEKDIQRHLGQMQDCDVQVIGLKATAEHPKGVQGINEKLDVMREFKEMLEDYLNQL